MASSKTLSETNKLQAGDEAIGLTMSVSNTEICRTMVCTEVIW